MVYATSKANMKKAVSISMNDLRSVFHVPYTSAHLLLGCSANDFRIATIRNRISKWPYRKIKSLKKTRDELMTLVDDDNSRFIKLGPKQIIMEEINMVIRNMYLHPDNQCTDLVYYARDRLCKLKHKMKKDKQK